MESADVKSTRTESDASIGTISSNPKLSAQIASKIEQDILAAGWKVGERLGSEAELTKRYGASRWVIREAINIAERDGLLEVRRGRGGGIIIAAPALDTIGSSIRSFLDVSRVSGQHLTEARALLESRAMVLATRRLDEASIQSLRDATERAENVSGENSLELAYDLLHELLSASGNELLTVFAYALAMVTADIALHRGVPESALRKAGVKLVEFRKQQIEAVIAYDADVANRLVNEQLQAMSEITFRQKRGKPNVQLLDLPHKIIGRNYADNGKVRKPKLTDTITQNIQTDIIRNNWPIGHNLGSEKDLMQRFEVSRSVLREGLRPLERLGVVHMQWGRNSCLKVTKPDPAAIIKSVVLYINYAGISPAAGLEILRALELAAVSGGARQPEHERARAISRIENCLEEIGSHDIEGISNGIADYYAALSELAPNPVISLLMRILGDAFKLDWVESGDSPEFRQDVEKLQDKIRSLAKAISEGDESMARRRMIELRKLTAPFTPGLKSMEEVI